MTEMLEPPPANTPRRTNVHLLNEVYTPEETEPTRTPPPFLMPSPTPDAIRQEQIRQASYKAAFVGTMNAIALVLTARLIVLISVLGAGWLTWVTLQSPDPYKLIALGIYCVGVVGGAVFLAAYA